MSFQKLIITIPGRPITKKNSQRIVVNPKTKRPIVLPSEKFELYQEEAGWHIHCKGLKLKGRYNVKCVYYMPTHHRVDLCNLLEATCDILTHYGVLDDDNSNIVAAHDGSRVCYSKEHPRVVITITELEDEAC